MSFSADLHIHTVLSPCADYTLIPELIVSRALDVGLDILGITDHNSAENAAAVLSVARRRGVAVLPGMEVESREGVHLLTLFDGMRPLRAWQATVYRSLPVADNDARLFGAQLVVTERGELVREERRLLMTAVSMSFEEIAAEVFSLGGLCIPAHIDRPANGLLGVLGFVPAEPVVPALEISSNCDPDLLLRSRPDLAGRTLVRSSDAHALEDIGKGYTVLRMASASVSELMLAFAGANGRAVARHGIRSPDGAFRMD